MMIDIYGDFNMHLFCERLSLCLTGNHGLIMERIAECNVREETLSKLAFIFRILPGVGSCCHCLSLIEGYSIMSQ